VGLAVGAASLVVPLCVVLVAGESVGW